jgi:hypothetical protein
VGDELSSADEAVDTESVVVVDLVDLVRALRDERQLVLDSLGFGSAHSRQGQSWAARGAC